MAAPGPPAAQRRDPSWKTPPYLSGRYKRESLSQRGYQRQPRFQPLHRQLARNPALRRRHACSEVPATRFTRTTRLRAYGRRLCGDTSRLGPWMRGNYLETCMRPQYCAVT
eukprot:364825-Chlamydomonas_euryale.AAC.14